MKNLKLYEAFAKTEKLDESRGSALQSVFMDLRDTVESLKGGSDRITPEDEKEMLKYVDDLEKKFKTKLKGKGILGW